jgi:chemotaxis protein methyltransferase CheR
MANRHLELIAQFLLEKGGLCFAGRRKPLLRSHLDGRLARLALPDLAAYHDLLRESPEELAALYEQVTVNETSFFRNRQQFEDLAATIIPRIEEEKERRVRLFREGSEETPGRRLRVLSAGCSTGEEPYSLAMTLLESLRYPLAWDLEILAGDLSEECLRSAARGCYPERKIASIPPGYRDRYLRKEESGWRVRDEVRRLVRFEKLNLTGIMGGEALPGIAESFPGFDLILCRNVMIYFPPAGQQLLVDALQRLLAPGGYLLTGDAEPLHLYSHQLDRVEELASLIYRSHSSSPPSPPPRPQDAVPTPPLPVYRIEELLQMVADGSSPHCPEARRTLLALGLARLAPSLESALRNDGNAALRNGAMELLVSFGEESVAMLSSLLRDPDDEVRNFCTVMLGSIGSRSAVPSLVAALEDPDPNVCHGAAEALGRIGDSAAVVPLIKLLDQGFWLQFPAVAALGELGSHLAVPRLVELLDEELLFEPVVGALQKIGDSSALPALRRAGRAGDARRARIVARVIAAIERGGDEEPAPPLMAAG